MSANAIETRDALVGAINGNPIDADTAWAILRRWDNMEALLEAAEAWWASKRPIHWAEAEHAAQPFVNCVGPREQALAAAVRRVESGQ